MDEADQPDSRDQPDQRAPYDPMPHGPDEIGVGPWQGPMLSGGELGFENDTYLDRWEPWVRAAILDFELLSHIHLSTYADTYADRVTGVATGPVDGVALWHSEFADSPLPPSAACKRIASFIRPDKAIFDRQLDFLQQYADLREDRASEILAQLGPPFAFWSTVVYLHPDRTPWTLELLGVALRLANFAEHRLKHTLACRRPIEYSPQVQPIILTPGHGSLPSGHATEAHIVAFVLSKLLKTTDANKDLQLLEQLMRQASRVAINRTIAGVHFPVDSAAGQMLGLALGQYLVHRCRDIGVGGTYDSWRFIGMNFDPALDFVWRDQYDTVNDAQLAAAFTEQVSAEQAQPSGLLNQLWKRAKAEVTNLLM